MSRRILPLLCVAGSLALVGCASQDSTSGAASPPAASASGAGAAGTSATGGCPITVADAWVKAADKGMTAAFAQLTNSGSAEVTLVSATTPAAARVEIHEVVSKDGGMVMQPKEAGLTLAAGATAQLAPGADHLMLMDLAAPIPAGASVELTLTCADGSTATMSAQAKTFTGAQEQYKSSASADPGTVSSPAASGSMGSMG